MFDKTAQTASLRQQKKIKNLLTASRKRHKTIGIMKKVDLRKVAVTLTAVFMMSIAPGFGLRAQETGKTAAKKDAIPVTIEYRDGEKIIPNAVVYLLYYDSEKSEPVEKSANTGNGKAVTFDVPLDGQGASFPFIVLYSKEEADKAKELLKTTTVRAFRTPPDSNCESLELHAGKDGNMRNEGCSIQMWSMGKR
jgi:hypothetical protein